MRACLTHQTSPTLEFALEHEDKKIETPKSKWHKDWILWVLLGTFVVASITFMVVADFYFSAELNNPNKLPDAVGK
jgi:hypothetical protein